MTPIELLAAAEAAHKGMTCCVTNMLRNRDRFGCEELGKHLVELKARWLDGDETAIAEFFALYRT